MKTRTRRIAKPIVAAATLALATCAPAGKYGEAPPEITVLAAASLAQALEGMAAEFENSHGIPVRVDSASSGLLAKKIEVGARADVFFSASSEYMEALQEKGLLLPETRRAFLKNRLVCVVPSDSTSEITALADLRRDEIERLALGDPGHVPAGRYAERALRNAGLWEEVKAKTIPCADVRAALATVEAGAADAALVYESDAATSERVRVAFVLRNADHGPILYEGSVLRQSRNRETAQAFLDFVASSAEAFAAYGFMPPNREAG
jgi:molybdate transport system substrate-binding protein